MRVNLAVVLFSSLAIALCPTAAGDVATIFPAAAAAEAPAEALAAELRRQGYHCEGPVNAERDAQLSRPDEPVWVVRCTNAAYRMRLVPHQAAHVERI